MKNVTKLVKELMFFSVALLVSVAIVLFALNKITNMKSEGTFAGYIEKEELRVVSPIFGSIEKIYFAEGELVKKGQTIAEISVFNSSQDKLDIHSSVFVFDGSNIKVVSPEDAIVAKKIFAEKSILKPGVDFLILHPLKDSSVKFASNSNSFLVSDYKKFMVKDSQSDKYYSIRVLDTLPVVSDKGNKRVYVASFENIEDSKSFYNNQQVDVKAEKKVSDNLLLSKIMLKFSSIIKGSEK